MPASECQPGPARLWSVVCVGGWQVSTMGVDISQKQQPTVVGALHLLSQRMV